MGVFKFSLKMLKTNISQTMLYLASVIFSAAVLFNSYNIMDEKSSIFSDKSVGQNFSLLLLFITGLSMFLVFFSNSYFINAKSKEFAIGELSGVSSGKLAVALGFQILTVGLIGSLLGIILGLAAMPGITAVVYKALGVQGNIYSFSSKTLASTIMVNIFVVCTYSIIGDYAYINDRKINDLINGQRQMYTPKNKDGMRSRASMVISIIIYIIPLTSVFYKVDFLSPILGINPIISVIAIERLLRYYLPEKIMELKETRYAKDNIKLVSLSNLHYSLRNIKIIVLSLSISTVLIVYIVGMSSLREVKAAGMFVYVYAVLSFGISILYKFITETGYRKHIFRQLRILGYNTKQLKRIVREETMMLYGIVVIVPLLHILVFLIQFNSFGIITAQLVEILLGIFIGLFIVMAVISYQVYKKQVL